MAPSSRLPGLSRALPDLALAALLLLIIGLMIVPVPTVVLDLLIAANLMLAVLMLLVAIAVQSGLGFFAMPTVLLITTLYRLALNVSSTRLILLQADAGRVIASFGHYVVRGNYAVGGVVFLVLTLIQYIVIARGSERVAEVGARFTLDAMPGKQMAIDAELRAGTLTPEQARESRRLIERESQFYGAMDGAMKFVKGDAIAAMVITGINLVAGVGIGVGMRGLDALTSLRTYGLLTIGDGLVCQIPALLISTSAGLVVTRVASHDEGESLGSDVQTQLFGRPRVLVMVVAFMALLATVPGLPAFPFATVAVMLAVVAYALRGSTPPTDKMSLVRAKFPEPLAPLVVRLRRAQPGLARALEARSEHVADALGIPAPPVQLVIDAALDGAAYRIELHETPRASGALPPGLETEALCDALEALLADCSVEFMNLQATQQLLDSLERSAPALVRNVVPKPVSLPLLTDVLRGLLAERVGIRPLSLIVEALAQGSGPKDAGAALELARRAVRRHIMADLSHGGALTVHPVDLLIEDALRDAVRPGGLGLAPDQAASISEAVSHAVANDDNQRSVVVTQPDTRAPLWRVIADELPKVAVLSYAELLPELRVELAAPVSLTARPKR